MWMLLLLLCLCHQRCIGGDDEETYSPVIRACNDIIDDAIDFIESQAEVQRQVKSATRSVAWLSHIFQPKCPTEITRNPHNIRLVERACFPRADVMLLCGEVHELKGRMVDFGKLVMGLKRRAEKGRFYLNDETAPQFAEECKKIADCKMELAMDHARIIEDAQHCARREIGLICEKHLHASG